ncbi:MAG: phage holin family protein [Chloroflexi bacterium]|nr:phage holin family protein [Chloroflexota bacterium]
MTVPEHRTDRSLGELFSDLSSETTTLVRQEISLARTEVTEKVTRVGKDLAFLAAGGAVLYAGFLAILAAIVFGLAAAGLPRWGSALIVGVVVALVGGFLVFKGLRDMKETELAPRATINSLKEDVKWAKEQKE